ncbi:MAG: hypothetical protein PVJ80_06010 [Gemmatimonadota bacterium]|jgi:opacity protein-like surface antigen
MKRSALAAALAVLVTAPTLASAQAGGPGFLFKKPRVSVGLRVGYAMPRTGGELFDYTLDEYIPLGADTLSSLSFDSPYLGGELAFRPWRHWDIAVGFGWTRSRSRSEYRRWIDTDGNPIQQETTFQVVSGTVGAKFYPQERGRQVGSLAWVPARLNPYVGGGIGVASYQFTQVGDFFDESTFEIFSDRLETSADAFLAYGTAGVDFTLTKSVLLTVEARYSISNGDVTGAYQGFNDMDLGGLQLMAGMGLQF